jgi:hypothetical protein
VLKIISNKVITVLDCAPLDAVAESTPGMSPAKVTAALDCVPPDGAGAAESTPGISPAKAVPDKTHASVIASNNRFMDFLL